MLYSLPTLAVVLLLFVMLLIIFYAGAFTVRKDISTDPNARAGFLSIGGTLLSLLLGFTFNSAAEKSFSRKQTFSAEISAITTCIDRAKLYPDSLRAVLMDDIKKYATVRKEYFDVGNDEARIKNTMNKSDSVYNILMERVAFYARENGNGVFTQQMVPAVNELSDLAAKREFLRTARVPISTLRMLLLLSFIIAFINGAGGALNRNRWYAAIGFAFLISMTLNLILDLDTPRDGYITLEEEQTTLIETLEGIK